MKLAELIRRAIEMAEPTGTITFNQLNDLVPSDQVGPEDIEALLSALSDADIRLVEE
ncbi:RNA polymerase sigma factor region1.1 domain-containing protein [Bradyrhizobium lablabi]|uniref:RNA polymerase sigma factor region1.1 domain-containing protein n=1 Tax=Bradyrhizobium lablabi TaxID=722472 RepID=UPI0009A8CF0D|nr:RNA polymerase sigma factor region1.1 domain-containing protein [Bradyrhizobium lablabi]